MAIGPETGVDQLQEANKIAATIDRDYAGRDKQAAREVEAIGKPQEALDSAEATLAEARALVDQLTESIKAGDFRSKDKQADLNALKDKVYNHLGWARPDPPANIIMRQERLQTIGDEIRRLHVAPTEKMLTALSEPLGEEALRAAGSDARLLRKATELGNTLPPERVTQLKEKVSLALDRLNESIPALEAQAQGKAWSKEEQASKQQAYQDAFDAHQIQRQELDRLMTGLRGLEKQQEQSAIDAAAAEAKTQAEKAV